MAKKKPTFVQALSDLPDTIDYDPWQMKTITDLRYACLIQLDLIEEGQDGTEDDDPRPIRGWLKKYGRPKETAESLIGGE
jgi:hypothetical protein